MSFHQVEDIVEDAIKVLAQSSLSRFEKRDLIHNLFAFQQSHDTSYTHFRVADILVENHYLYTWPLEKHPDYAENKAYFDQLDIQKNPWIKGLAEKGETCFGRIKDGKPVIYFDAGDSFWQRVKEQLSQEHQTPPQDFSIPVLFLKMLELASEQKATSFVKEWYGAFANFTLEVYFTEEEGLPKSFQDWTKEKTLLKIRSFAEKHKQVLTAKSTEAYPLFPLPKLKDELEFATEADEKAKIQFLLDFDTALEKIEKNYQKEVRNKDKPENLRLVHTFFSQRLGDNWIAGEPLSLNDSWEYSFLKKIKEENGEEEAIYVCLLFTVYTDFRAISCKIGIQNGLILAWQQREPSHQAEYQHFVQSLSLYLTEEDLAGNKHIDQMGGWKYDLRKSEKTLRKKLENLWEIYEKRSPSVFRFYKKSLATWGRIADEEKLLKKRKNALNKGYNFFGNEMDFKLMLACWHHRKGSMDQKQHYLDGVEAILQTGKGSEGLRKRIKQGLDVIKHDRGTYPELSTLYSGRLKDY